jgi:hypothetical protein
MFDSSNVEILSGNDEAQFSWITVNSQLQNVGPNSTVFPRKKEIYGKITHNTVTFSINTKTCWRI